MAKRREEERPRMEDEVRYTGIMTRADRARFKYFCERIGADMERIGPSWIMDRLAEEERKLAAPPAKRGNK